MEDDAGRNAEAAYAPCLRQRQIGNVGEDVGEVVQRKCGRVAEDALACGPQPENDEILVFLGRKVANAVDPAPRAEDPAHVHVVDQEFGRKAECGRLSSGEVAGLRNGEIEK